MNKPGTDGGHSDNETVSGLIVSLLFWLSLLVAASLFMAVALAPKLAETLRLQDLYADHQLKLVAVESQNLQLQRVVEAIRDDADFAAEMARIEFDAVRSDEEIIPVATALKLETHGTESPRTQPIASPAWYRPWLTLLTENDRLRSSLLGTAAVLVVVSFTWFQTASPDRVARRGQFGHTTWQAIRNRYVQPQ